MTKKEAIDLLSRTIKALRNSNEAVRAKESRQDAMNEAISQHNVSGIMSVKQSEINQSLINEAPFALIELISLTNENDCQCEY